MQADIEIVNLLKSLPVDFWDFKNDNTKEYTHGLHNYPAVMVSPISRNIINLVRKIRPINALLDPFSGSGTVIVEGMINEVPLVSGNDINPLALLLTKVKTTPLNIEQLEIETNNLKSKIMNNISKNKHFLDTVDNYISKDLNIDISNRKGWGDNAFKYLSDFCTKNNLNLVIPNFKNIGYWFRPKVILELSIIKESIDKIDNKDIREFTLVAFSETIRLVSNRRNGEFKMFRMQADKVLCFKPDVYDEFIKIINRNIEKMRDFVSKIKKNKVKSNVSIYRNNACLLNDLPDNTYDLIITSPPYGDSKTTVAYGEYSRLSLQWINLYNLSEKEIMSVDKFLMGGTKYRKGFEMNLNSKTLETALEIIKSIDLERAGDVYSFYKDLNQSIKNSAKKTKSGGYHFWVVGNRTVKNVLLKTDIIISELAEQYGLETIYTIDRNIFNKVMSSLNSPTNISGNTSTTMTMEHIVVLKKR